MTWQDALADELAAGGVDVAVQVPDSRLDGVVRGLAARGTRIRTLTREEECVGYAAGVRLAGGRPLALMQCSGLGNALNALGSLGNLLAVVLADGAYSITGGQPLVAETRFADVATSLPGLASATASTREDLARAVAETPRPGLVCAQLTEQVWPGPSPFVDPALVRSRFATTANDHGKGGAR